MPLRVFVIAYASADTGHARTLEGKPSSGLAHPSLSEWRGLAIPYLILCPIPSIRFIKSGQNSPNRLLLVNRQVIHNGNHLNIKI